MLKISNYIASSSGTLVIDEFVPISFRVSPFPRPDPFIWRTGDFQRNLFEIKIDRRTGELFAATLVIFAGVPSPYDPAIHSHAESVYGLPVVDVSELSSGVTDEIHPIIVGRFANEMWLYFGKIERPTKSLQCGRTKFLIREMTLIGMGFTELTSQETKLLDVSLDLNPE